MTLTIEKAVLAAAAGWLTWSIGLAWAGPLDPALVPADARWAAHVDMEQAKRTKVGGYVRSVIEEYAGATLSRAQEQFGLHPFEDVRSLTFFRSATGTGRVAAIVLTTAAGDRFASSLSKAGPAQLQSSEVDGVTILTWTELNQKWRASVIRTEDDVRAIVFASTERDVLEAVKVVAERKTLAEPPAKLAFAERAPGEGSIVYAAVRELGSPTDMDDFDGSGVPDGPSAVIFQHAKHLLLDVGESSSESFFANVRMQASSESDANSMRDMAQGVLAVARMSAKDKPDLNLMGEQFWDGLKTSVQGTTFEMSFTAAAPALVAAMRRLDAMCPDGKPMLATMLGSEAGTSGGTPVMSAESGKGSTPR